MCGLKSRAVFYQRIRDLVALQAGIILKTMHKTSLSLKPWHALITLILLNLILATFIGNDFGISWDEPSYSLYGERSFGAYQFGLDGKPLIPERHIFFMDLRYYGPVYTATVWKIVELLTPLLNTWAYSDLWHLINFSFFQISLVALFLLARRYLTEWTAFFITLVFSTQPLLFGHAFINPKDIPFLTFFLVSVTMGLKLTDVITKQKPNSKDSNSNLNLFIAILFGLYAFTYIGKDIFFSIISAGITSIYIAPANTLGGKVFAFLANNANPLPVENYIHKAVSAHLERGFLIFLFILVVSKATYNDYTQNKRVHIPKPDWTLWMLVVLAGIILGLTTSIRLLAPLAGVMIAGFALWTNGKKALPPLIIYFSIAALASYWTWPFLWDSPTFHFLEAFKVMSDFPFGGEVNFFGDNYQPTELPWFYVPFLVSAQITEPVVILAWVGFFVIVSKFIIKEKQDTAQWSIILIWFIMPIALQIILGSGVYDNFRQFLFILPPMFILAGLGWESLLSKIKLPVAQIALAVFCILPGLIGVISLHPYPYIYYNTLVGGVRGAEGRFETDYWLTSYREAALYLQENAPQNAKILTWGAGYNVQQFSRDDLAVYDFNIDEEVDGAFAYAVITTRFDMHKNMFKDAEVVFEVRKSGVLLAVVKKLEQ